MDSPVRCRSNSPPTTSRKTRQSTRCKEISKSRVFGKKQPLDFDDITRKTKRSHQVKLSTYLGKLARENVSILYEEWRLVPGPTKDLIWLDVLANFEIKNSSALKLKVLQSVGTKWKNFKSTLTRDYVFGKLKDKNPCEMYGIQPSEWEEFKKSRLDPSWEEKRQKAQEKAKKNDAPHILSRGGYALLDEQIIENKVKKRREKASQSGTIVDFVVNPPSPPSRHERFKLARTKKSGEMTSDAARDIAKRIDELVEECSNGSFVVEGRTDILTTAIGRSEHPGRVRGVGGCVGIREYFGSQSSGPSDSMSPEFLDRLTSTITEKVKKEVTAEIGEQIRKDVTQKLLQQFAQPVEVEVRTPPVELDPNVIRSGKGSCVGHTNIPSHSTPPADIVTPSGDIPADIVTPSGDIPARSTPRVNNRCELYIVDHSSLRLVALGTIHEGGSTLHGVPLSTDLFRVEVEDVRDGNAPVPVPSEEVLTVRQAVGGFIAWPKHLVKALSTQDNERPKKQARTIDDPILELVNISGRLYNSPFRVPCDTSIFGFENDVPVHIHFKEVLNIAQGKTCLDISILQLWIMFLKSLVVENRFDNVYGFFEPRSMQNMGSKKHSNTLSSSIVKYMQESKKQT